MTSGPTALARRRVPRVTETFAVSFVYVAAMFMSLMDSTIVNVALPAIGRTFRVQATSVDIVSISFLVSLAVFIPASGWLGDRFGGRRVLLSAILVFTLASAACGVASSLTELVVFRILQGVGGGMLAPVGMAMLFRAFGSHRRMRASTILLIPTAVAPALGPVLGGLLVTDASWRWVFFINLPIGVGAVLFGVRFLHPPFEPRDSSFDLVGFLLAGLGLGAFMYGFSEAPEHGWASASTLTTLTAGLLLLTAMTWIELRKTQPLLRLRLFTDSRFSLSNAVVVLVSIGFLGVLYAISLYYQDARGLSALAAGLSILPQAIGVLLGTRVAPRLLPVLGPRRHLSVGVAMVATTIALLALLGPGSSLWWARALMFLIGLGMGSVLVPIQAICFQTISREQTGDASTLFNAVRQLGGAIGVALLTTVIVLVGPRPTVHHAVGAVSLHAYRIAFLVAAGVTAAAILPAGRVPPPSTTSPH